MQNKGSQLLTSGLKLTVPRSFYFLIFFISGFSGLIYESIWSHYLKLFLGHAAYAQSLVLIIFMGGMALGSWLASRFSERSKTPLLIYAGIEFLVGVAALLFHDTFTSLIDTFYITILPSVDSPVMGSMLQWLAASLLIMPQSILLGMTFPMMSAGILRRFPGTSGSNIAMLYFTNSIGAAIGVLASGFWLIKQVGLPGAVFSAGLINILLSVIVWITFRLDPSPINEPTKKDPSISKNSSLSYLFLLAALITGAASFIYEISWIRMLSLVLGATTHSFELMLSAFIAGLAFGGLWIKSRIDKIRNPIRFSGYVQLIMGLLALITIPVYASTFDFMAWLLKALDVTDSGYVSYNIASHAIALAVMLPTTFMAGMTLPLFTSVLLTRGHGERSIGQIYAANTVGAILGVLFAVHIGLPNFGLKNLIIVGAFLDIALGLVLLFKDPVGERSNIKLVGGALVGIGALIASSVVYDLSPQLLASGVYRTEKTEVSQYKETVFYQDGKTASIALVESKVGFLSLFTNGKADASIQLDPDKGYTPDEVTMVLLGSLPLAYNADAKKTANIGMGSGLTTHVLLGNSDLESVDTIEIESSIVSASRGFGKHVERAFLDPRSNIHIEDAKTFFSTHSSEYDIIIAEPSNPWVSGVASLFSTEFYRTVKRYLTEDGIFVQWLQLYEFDNLLASSVLKALSENFEDYVIYNTDSSNILIVASNKNKLPEPDWSVLFTGEMGKDLKYIDIQSEHDLTVRKLIDRENLLPYLSQVPVPVNSDYFPFVDLNAGKARYQKSLSSFFYSWLLAPLPMLEMLSGNEKFYYDKISETKLTEQSKRSEGAKWMHNHFTNLQPIKDVGSLNINIHDSVIFLTEMLEQSVKTCRIDGDINKWRSRIHSFMTLTLPYLDGKRGLELVSYFANANCKFQNESTNSDLFNLYGAVANRDPLAMSTYSRKLLDKNESLTRNLQEYLLFSAMLGDVVQGRVSDAQRIWNKWGEVLFDKKVIPEHLILLKSIAFDQQK